MSNLRILIVLFIVSVVSLPAVAQTPDTGPIKFPQVTNTNIVDCLGYPGTVPGPGGKVFFFRGGFYNRNGVIYLGATTHGAGCFGEVNVQFSPAATDISFTLTNFAPQTIHVNGLDYSVGRNAVIPISVPGTASGLLITAGLDFAITDLVITQHPVNEGFVRFDLNASVPPTSDQTKILISKAIWDIGYPSTVQLAPDSSGNPQVKIAGTLLDAQTGQPKSGAVFLRVEDPPDTAPYRGADAHRDDNDGPPAVLSSTTVSADGQGHFEATLSIHSRIAGDNYQVVGSADEHFKCSGGLCPHSAIFTLWKRTYVEDASMFRSGTFLTDGADAGSTTFGIRDPAPFQALPFGAALKLIHADTGGGEGFHWDIVYFTGMQRDSNGHWNLTVDADPGLSGQPLTRDYGTSVGGAHASSNLPWAPLLADAVGVVSADTYAATTVFVPPTLAGTFVEMKQIAPVIDEVPYLAIIPPLPDNIQYSDHWFEHSEGPLHKALPNLLHRIGASLSAPIFFPASNGVPAGWGVHLGRTIVGGGNNVSFTFTQRIEELSVAPAVSPRGTLIAPEYQHTNPAIVNARTTAHETVHFWVRMQRQGITDDQGHCHAMQYDDPSLTCLMHEPAGANGLDSAGIHMHYVKLPTGAVDSEYLIVRRAADPVPQN